MNDSKIIVIGNSISNLICGALLVNAGLDVRYIKLGKRGQYVGYFPENDGKFPMCEYSFDCKQSVFSKVINEIGFDAEEFFEESVECLHIFYNDREFFCEFNWESYKKMLLEQFIDERVALSEYFSDIEKLNNEWLLMVSSMKMPSIKNITNIIKFSKMSYIEYVEKKFVNKELIQILTLDVVNKDVSVIVMAGYIMQMYSGKQIKNGYHEGLEMKLYEKIGKSNIIEVECQEIDYDYSEENKKFVVSVEKKIYESDYLVLSGDYKLKFCFAKEDVQKGYSIYINCVLKEAFNEGKKIFKFVKNAGNNMKYVSVMAQNATFVQVRINVETKDNWVMCNGINNIIDDVETYCGKVHFYEVVEEEEIETSMKWSDGKLNVWSFSAESFKENPLAKRFCLKGLYLTECWGRAFVTGAIITSKNIMEDIVTMGEKNGAI